MHWSEHRIPASYTRKHPCLNGTGYKRRNEGGYHQQLLSFLEEILPEHNNVHDHSSGRWLRRGKGQNTFGELHEEICGYHILSLAKRGLNCACMLGSTHLCEQC